LEEITPYLKETKRSTAIPANINLVATLRFLAEGGYQHSVSQDFNIKLCHQYISNFISEVCTAIENVLCPNTIKRGV
jgi:hypothetical protein